MLVSVSIQIAEPSEERQAQTTIVVEDRNASPADIKKLATLAAARAEAAVS
jgi:aspartate carbamoyltransferase regulatory subunit